MPYFLALSVSCSVIQSFNYSIVRLAAASSSVLARIEEKVETIAPEVEVGTVGMVEAQK